MPSWSEFFHKIIPQDVQTLESQQCEKFEHGNEGRYTTTHKNYKISKVLRQKQGLSWCALAGGGWWAVGGGWWCWVVGGGRWWVVGGG